MAFDRDPTLARLRSTGPPRPEAGLIESPQSASADSPFGATFSWWTPAPNNAVSRLEPAFPGALALVSPANQGFETRAAPVRKRCGRQPAAYWV